MTTAQLTKPQAQEDRPVDSQFQHLATLNKWLERAYKTNARYNTAYNFYADWNSDLEAAMKCAELMQKDLQKILIISTG